MKTFATIGISVAALGLAIAGCGRQAVSGQLADARLTVERARASEARTRAPGELYQAERILRRAELAEDGSRAERHFAYLADRQARIAMADARTAQLSQATADAQRAYLADLERSAASRGAAAAAAQESQRTVAEAAAQVEAQRAEAERAAAQAEAGRLTAEQAAARAEQERQAAQRELQQAIQRIEEVAQVRQEPTQTVITIPGEVLFETDKSQLLPTARQKLDVVADSLRAQPHAGRIVVTGHADAHGSDTYNQELSERRAESVKDFLVQQGVASNEIQAVGRGESQPIADNASPEGRANNRRVEIILPRQPAGQAAPPSQRRPARPLERPEQQQPPPASQQQQQQQQQPMMQHHQPPPAQQPPTGQSYE